MKSSIITKKIIWPSHPDKLESIATNPVGAAKFPMLCAEEIGAGTVECLNLNLGMDIANGCFTPSSAQETETGVIPLSEVMSDLLESTLEILSPKTGRAAIYDHRLDKKYDIDNSANVFVNTDRVHISYLAKKNQQYDVVHLIMGESILGQFLGEEVAQSLLKNLNVSVVPASEEHAVPLEISKLLHAAFSNHLTGDIRKIYAQSAVLNYLSHLSNHFSCGEKRSAAIKQLKIEEIKNELLQHEGKLPSLSELTTMYGMSATALNSEFKKLTGKSVHTFVMDHRLVNAYQKLEQTDIAMKVLADSIGYSHVNHFISAFKKKFNRTPGSLRR